MRKIRLALFFGLAAILLQINPSFSLAEKETVLYTTLTKTATATTAQSAATLWTPASGFRFILQGVAISSDRAIVVRLQVSGTDVIPPQYITSNGTVVIGGGTNPIYTSTADAVLTWTTTNSPVASNHGRVSVMAWGYEDKF